VLLRTSRRQVEEKPPIRASILGFLGAKGGVGTTTLAVNVAVALAQEYSDRQVVFADMQSGMSSVVVQMGLRRHGGIKRLLERPADQIGPRAVEAQLEEHKSGVRVLWGEAEPIGVATPLLPDHAEAIIQHLGAMADYLLLDLGVGLGETNRRILPNCEHIVVAIEPHRAALRLAQALLDEMTSALTLPRYKISVVLINKAPSASTFTKEAMEGLLQHDLAGVVTPAPELAFQAAESGSPMVSAQPTSLVAQQLRNIAEYLVNI
jgi:pilus assembly protein CpaE